MDKLTMDRIIRYEEGDISEDEAVELFTSLVKTGAAWSLQGTYGRQAIHLIQEGLIEKPDDDLLPPRVRAILSDPDFCES